MKKTAWSNWRSISQPADYINCAIYKIRLCSREIPVQINRFLGTDDEGLLCIGKTANMEDRRKQFVSGMSGKYGHSEGNLLDIINRVSPLQSVYPNPQYEYSFAGVDSGQEGELEEKQIKSYVKRFGEVPPLNSAIPKRYDNW